MICAIAKVAAFVLVLLAAGPGTAATETTEVQATGHGPTPREALADALAEAVRQVNGVAVDAQQFLKSTVTADSTSDGDGQRDRLSVATDVEQKIGVSGSGLIAGYDVISNEASEFGFTAIVSARVLRYVAPGVNSADRRRLAVIPRASVRTRYDVYSSMSGDEITDRFASTLEALLVQARRFAVLDRVENAALAEERERWRSSDAPLAEQAKLGQSLGVDYLLFTRILDARAGVRTEHITLTDEYIQHPYAKIEVEVRVVSAPTAEVKFADTVSLGLSDLGGGGGVQAMLDHTATRVANLITERIFPLQIIGAQQEEFVLNQGGRSTKVGELFRVIQRGEELTDPYTHESLGFAETEVGTIKVTRVDARVAYARIVDGVAQAGMSLRRAGYAATAPRRKAGPPPEPKSGVKLPFDP